MNLAFCRFFYRTCAAEVLACDGDSSAIEKARELLSESDYFLIEVWQVTGKVEVVQPDGRAWSHLGF